MIGAITGGYAQQNGYGYMSLARQQPQQPSPSGLAQNQTVNSPEGKNDGNGIKDLSEKYRCRTCESRTYMDGSNDPGVSMKTPTKVNAASAASTVMAHEQEHVTRNSFKAQAEGRRVISSSVTIHSGVCGECGKTYVAGGTTRTVTAGKDWGKPPQQDEQPRLDMRI